jgi:hypothetical protein
MRKYFEGPDSPKERVVFEILALSTKKSRHRWTRIGNISENGALPPTIIMAGEKPSNAISQTRSHLRVVTSKDNIKFVKKNKID